MLPPIAEGAAPLPFEREIAFDRVSFAYGDAGFAVRNVSLVIPRGSRIGIAGTTGSGKSTLLDLLMGLLEPGEARSAWTAARSTRKPGRAGRRRSPMCPRRSS